MAISLFSLKAGLLFFWSLWLTLVCLTNTCEGLKALGRLPATWPFASENYAAIKAATSTYSLPGWLPGLLFLGVILWQGAAVILFWLAWWRYGSGDTAALSTAFAVSLALWAAFMIADEVFKIYDSQRLHLHIFLAQLVTLLTMILLPQ
jgi:hypothetical protein